MGAPGTAFWGQVEAQTGRTNRSQPGRVLQANMVVSAKPETGGGGGEGKRGEKVEGKKAAAGPSLWLAGHLT